MSGLTRSSPTRASLWRRARHERRQICPTKPLGPRTSPSPRAGRRPRRPVRPVGLNPPTDPRPTEPPPDRPPRRPSGENTRRVKGPRPTAPLEPRVKTVRPVTAPTARRRGPTARLASDGVGRVVAGTESVRARPVLAEEPEASRTDRGAPRSRAPVSPVPTLDTTSPRGRGPRARGPVHPSRRRHRGPRARRVRPGNMWPGTAMTSAPQPIVV